MGQVDQQLVRMYKTTLYTLLRKLYLNLSNPLNQLTSKRRFMMMIRTLLLRLDAKTVSATHRLNQVNICDGDVANACERIHQLAARVAINLCPVTAKPAQTG